MIILCTENVRMIISEWNMWMIEMFIWIIHEWCYTISISTHKYSAHINVEICKSIQIIKYIHKYMYKEKDQTIMKLKNNLNEITCHLNDHYISLNQTVWNLFEFCSHIENSFIMHLIMHFSDEQLMYFSKNVTAK